MEIFITIIVVVILLICIAIASNQKPNRDFDRRLQIEVIALRNEFIQNYESLLDEMLQAIGGTREGTAFKINFTVSGGDPKAAKATTTQKRREASYYRKQFAALKREIPTLLRSLESRLPPHEFGAYGARRERYERQLRVNADMMKARENLESLVDQAISTMDKLKIQLDRSLTEQTWLK